MLTSPSHLHPVCTYHQWPIFSHHPHRQPSLELPWSTQMDTAAATATATTKLTFTSRPVSRSCVGSTTDQGQPFHLEFHQFQASQVVSEIQAQQWPLQRFSVTPIPIWLTTLVPAVRIPLVSLAQFRPLPRPFLHPMRIKIVDDPCQTSHELNVSHSNSSIFLILFFKWLFLPFVLWTNCSSSHSPPILPSPSLSPPATAFINLLMITWMYVHFAPTDIAAECSDDYMKVTIHYNGTFTGLVYSSGYVHDPNCIYVNGTGRNHYEFFIRLNQCGTLGRQEMYHPKRPGEVRVSTTTTTTTVEQCWGRKKHPLMAKGASDLMLMTIGDRDDHLKPCYGGHQCHHDVDGDALSVISWNVLVNWNSLLSILGHLCPWMLMRRECTI